ncbi:MAG: aspartate--tRNA ligase [Bacteroidia bacterium]|nr:aspartate--tRNA ligase [Bacteroidia bacterium]MDW8347454.1 aspartate--tRNA ligase [Bacteroidia bacterium]
MKTFYRTHTCGELRLTHQNETVTLCGWIQRIRELKGQNFIDLRDRYGITQLVFSPQYHQELYEKSKHLQRETVIQITGKVIERFSKNLLLPTGEIEIIVQDLTVLNTAKTPPFLIENETDGSEELRMQYRYLDIRRPVLRDNLILRHKFTQAVRNYMDSQGFIEIETPVLIKSTPEGARDFVVPSRMNKGQFYALPQSPQTFKQLLMVAGMDKYFQIVKCFRDEDLRADRQPEFTQIDCEMSFVHQEDVLQTFEGLVKHLFKTLKGIEIPDLPRMTYDEAIRNYGTDKPDLRFDMKFTELNEVAKGHGFSVFDSAELVVGICAKGAGNFTRKQIDYLTNFVKKPQIGASGLVHARIESDGSIKSSVDKFYSPEQLLKWKEKCKAEPGDLILILSGNADKVRKQLSELRLEVAAQLGLRDKDKYACLWVVDFPLLEWNEEDKRWYAMHHPFTSPKKEDIHLLGVDNARVRANAYDLVINGVEIGGGSVRIHDRRLQSKMFEVLGLSQQEAEHKFGFLMNAFEYGAPPHAGCAFGLDRWVMLFAGADSIREVMAFPKNNMGRDVMIDAPSTIDDSLMQELGIQIQVEKE